MFFSEGFSWDSYLILQTDDAASPTKPSLHPDNNSNSSEPPLKQPTPSKTALRNLCPGIRDHRLLNTALDLQEFTLAANIAFQTGRKIPPDLFRETQVSVQYRLLALRDEDDERRSRQQQQQQHQRLETEELSHPIPEETGPLTQDTITAQRLLCLGMLAFTTTTFLKIKQLPMRYVDLVRRMRECVHTLGGKGGAPWEAGVNGGCSPQAAAAAAPGRLELWFLFVARISVLDAPEDEEMLVAATARVLRAMGLGGAGWDQVRDVLRAFMWVDWLHSEGGRAFWEVVSARGDVVSMLEDGVPEEE